MSPDTTPELNLVGRPGVVLPDLGGQRARHPVGGIPASCQAPRLPRLDIAHAAAGVDLPGRGAASAEEAFRTAHPALTEYRLYPFAGSASVWIVAGVQTFIALAPGPAEGDNWYVYPAKFLGCFTSTE